MIMYKGYKNQLKYKNPEYNKIFQIPALTKCKKCQMHNAIPYSPAHLNTYYCAFCGTPNYIIKTT